MTGFNPYDGDYGTGGRGEHERTIKAIDKALAEQEVQMIQPKDALEPLAKATEAFGAFSDRRNTEEIWLWVRGSNIKGREYGITLQDALNAKAAIPVAELHQQAVEILKQGQRNIETGIWQPIKQGQWYEEVGVLLARLKALK